MTIPTSRPHCHRLPSLRRRADGSWLLSATPRLRPAAILGTLVLAATLLVGGCDDGVPASSCLSDADCTGGEICFAGQCALPTSVDATSDTTGGGDSADTNSPPDVGADTRTDTTLPPDIRPDQGPTDVSPGNICDRALAHLDMCPELKFVGQYGIEWPRCSEREACAADCTLQFGCDEMWCDFHPDIDCDDIGPVGKCIEERCDGIAPSGCSSDLDCGSTYDCCGQAWLCFDRDNAPMTCDMACEPPLPSPGCGCIEGQCRAAATTTSVCQEGLDHFFDCGYAIAGLPAWMDEDIQMLASLMGPTCDDTQACYARCLLDDAADPCSRCHFDSWDCMRDPFQECVETCTKGGQEEDLCWGTGGQWGSSSCESCCGPTQCGQDPGAPCPLACCGPPQCYCPDSAPFWSQERGCFSEPSCFP